MTQLPHDLAAIAASGTPPRQRALVVLATFLAALGAAYSGLSVGSGNKAAIVLPLAVCIALVLAALATTHFAEFVFFLLVIRTAIDLAKLSGPTAGTVAANSAAQRGLDPSSMLAVLFLLAAILWLIAQYRERGSLPGSSLRRGLVVFGAASLLSVTGSERMPTSALEALRIVAVIVMFIVLEQMMTDRTAMKRFLLAAFLSAIFPLGYTAFTYVFGAPAAQLQGDFSRLTGPFSQSNTFGRYLMLIVIFGVALYPHLEKRLRFPMAVILTAGSVCLLLTYTLTALIGTVVGLVIVGIFQSKRVLGALLVVGLCAVLVLPQLAGRLTALSQSDAAANIESGNSLEWRLTYWTQVLPLANDNPVTGIGLSMTQYNTRNAKQPHNDFLRAYVETGLIGLGAYLSVLALVLGLGRRAVRASRPRTFDRGVAVGFLGCAVAFAAVSMAANLISNVVTLWYFMTFAAAASAVARNPTAPLAETTRNPRRGGTVPEIGH